MSTSGDKSTTRASNPNQYYEVTPSPSDSVSSLSFSPQANILVATSWDNQVRCWEVTGSGATIASEPKVSVTYDKPILCSAWSDDGTKVFTGGCDHEAKLWPLSSGVKPYTVARHDAPISKLAWLPESNLLATGSWDKTIKYWDTRQPSLVHTQQLADKCYGLAVNGNMMVVASGNGQIVVFDLRNRKVEFKRIESDINYQTKCIAAFPDQKGFLVGSIAGRIGVHHLDDAQTSQNYVQQCHKVRDKLFTVNSLNFHPIHGTYASTGSDGTFCFWDKDSRSRLKKSRMYDQQISCGTFNHDGSIFAYAAGYDWSRGAAHKPLDDKTSIFLYQPQEAEVKSRPAIPKPGTKKSGRFTITQS